MSKLKSALVLISLMALVLAVALNIPGTVAQQEQPPMRLPPMPVAASKVKIHFLETGSVETTEAFIFAQGSLFKKVTMVHGAILIQHGDDSLLFDTGLGRGIHDQFSRDMPFWLRPLMSYKKGEAAADQIQAQGLPPPRRIFLSHAHWDHASGLPDFPNAETWITAAEHAYLLSSKARAALQVFPSQVDSPVIRWHDYALANGPYAGFEKSYDVYGDGTLVLVSLAGHSPGSVGLFVNSQDGQRRFFVGDAVWNLAGIEKLRHKFWFSSWLADFDRAETGRVIARMALLMRTNPQLKIIPAHDLKTWQ